jgi:hypothetical protein
MLNNAESALNTLANLEVRDEQVRREIDHVERALRSIRETLYRTRWI